MSDINDDDLLKALDRIARTADGALLYLYLQRECLALPGAPDPSDGALRANHGRRSFAAELMGRMAKGMDESGGRTTDSTPGRSTERPVVFRTRDATGVRRLTAREHIAAHDPELAVKPGDD